MSSPLWIFAPAVAHAQVVSDINKNLHDANSGFGSKDLITIIGGVIQAALGVLGVIFVILIIYAGFRWFMARGVAGEVTKAVDTMREAVVGLVIILTASAVTYFVMSALQTATK